MKRDYPIPGQPLTPEQARWVDRQLEKVDRQKLVKIRWSVTIMKIGPDTASYVGYGDEPEMAFKQARKEISSAEDEKAVCEAEIRRLVDLQAKDDGLWFVAQTAAEGYLQQELRKLHSAIEAAQNSGRTRYGPQAPEAPESCCYPVPSPGRIDS